jgi:uncharacterized protein (TIGR03086 family)
MDDHVAMFTAAVGAFDEKVRATPPDRWSAPSPCEGWTAADVLRHCIGNVRGVAAALRGDDFMAARGEAIDGELLDAWAGGRDAVEAVLSERSVPAEIVVGGGTIGIAAVLDGVMRDLVIHAWDIARAAGVDERLPEGVVRDAITAMALVTDDRRRPGGYGPVLPVAETADDLARLLALSGRRR